MLFTLPHTFISLTDFPNLHNPPVPLHYEILDHPQETVNLFYLIEELGEAIGFWKAFCIIEYTAMCWSAFFQTWEIFYSNLSNEMVTFRWKTYFGIHHLLHNLLFFLYQTNFFKAFHFFSLSGAAVHLNKGPRQRKFSGPAEIPQGARKYIFRLNYHCKRCWRVSLVKIIASLILHEKRHFST